MLKSVGLLVTKGILAKPIERHSLQAPFAGFEKSGAMEALNNGPDKSG